MWLALQLTGRWEGRILILLRYYGTSFTSPVELIKKNFFVAIIWVLYINVICNKTEMMHRWVSSMFICFF
jgi:hypothetical protein